MIKYILNVFIYYCYFLKGDILCLNRLFFIKCIDFCLENLLLEYVYEGNLLILLFF